MQKISLPFAIAAASLAFALPAAPAHAQAFRTWVSGVGDDANPCSRTAPCKTFAGAISKTALNGEINCLDPGGFGAVTITKSITIDCREIFASILFAGTNGINIPFNSFAAADVRKTVRLRNLNLNGTDSGIVGIRITGGSTIAGGVVIIEDCLIDGVFAGAATGISDERTAGGELYVSNTTVRNAGSLGIAINPPAAGQRIDAAFDNVHVQNTNNHGIFIGNNGRAVINRSVISGNSSGGIVVSGLAAAAEANVSNSVITSNSVGVANVGGTVTIRLFNNDVAFNNTAFFGATQSHVNNRVQGNLGLGTAPTQIGQTTNPTGLQ
jgi:Right handed beta helix region